MSKASRAWTRRHNQHYSLRTRWRIIQAREHRTWGQWWADVVYLIRGA